MKVQYKSDLVFTYEVTLADLSKTHARQTQNAFTVIKELRNAGARNVMCCLGFRLACTSAKDKKAVQKVGVRKVKEAYDFLAREFGV